MNFVINKSKYRRNSRKIDSKSIKKCSKTSKFFLSAPQENIFKLYECFCTISKNYLIFS